MTEQVYDCYYDTVGNYHWKGVYSGEHIERSGKMNRYIDLDNPKIHKMGRDKFGNVIYHIPPDTSLADVRENVYGEWVKDEGYDKRDNFYHCSECGRTINIICGGTLENYPFCHCGADMRKVRNKQ